MKRKFETARYGESNYLQNVSFVIHGELKMLVGIYVKKLNFIDFYFKN